MDLRINAKRVRALPLKEVQYPGWADEYPTPPPSIESPSGSSGVQEEVLKYPSIKIFKKLDSLKKANVEDTEKPPNKLVYRSVPDYSQIKGNHFLALDREEFCNNKRVKREKDWLKEENVLKKFKPVEYQILSKTLRSTGDRQLLELLQEAGCDSIKSSSFDNDQDDTVDFASSSSYLVDTFDKISRFSTEGSPIENFSYLKMKPVVDENNKPSTSGQIFAGKVPQLPLTSVPKPKKVKPLSPVAKQGFKKLTPSKPIKSVRQEIAAKYPYPSEQHPDKYVIGPNGSTIAKTEWENINWDLTHAAITRKILMCLFDKSTLATHTLTGRPSPAFIGMGKPKKQPLDPNKVADTVMLVTSRVNVTSKEVRMTITTKCADEAKMLRIREQKKAKFTKEIEEIIGVHPA